jgi:hypothetical protein
MMMRMRMRMRMMTMMMTTTTIMMMRALFSCRQDLTASTGFAALALFDLLRFPLVVLPDMINYLIKALVSFGRIESFLEREEVSISICANPNDRIIRVVVMSNVDPNDEIIRLVANSNDVHITRWLRWWSGKWMLAPAAWSTTRLRSSPARFASETGASGGMMMMMMMMMMMVMVMMMLMWRVTASVFVGQVGVGGRRRASDDQGSEPRHQAGGAGVHLWTHW